MILAVDPGYAKCGWAVVEPGTARVAALGVIVTEQDKRADKSTDRARRVVGIARQLAGIVCARKCHTIAAEQMLGHGAAAAVAANMLPWGALIGLGVALGLELREVPAKAWQHAAIAMRGRKVDYRELAQELETFVRTHAEPDLLRIATGDRTHALDAVGVGLYAAMTSKATSIAEVVA